MSTFSPSFTYANIAAEKELRTVVSIEFDTDSIYITSHAGIPNVPGVVLERMLRNVSSVSQRIIPHEGRSEIGSMSFEVVDVAGAATTAFRAKRQGGTDLRGRTVRLYVGFSAADFSQYQIFQTQTLQKPNYKDGVYSISCSDITREQRQDILEPKRTTLTQSVVPGDSTINVQSTSGFDTVAHGTTWSDAPSATVGYIKIGNTVIRYTGKTDTTFTGCTHGVLNTRAVTHNVDLSQPQDQRTRVEEYIYLELPAPQLALALMTGENPTLPEHWHMGIDADEWIETTDFTGIGQDLWHPTSPELSFVPVFQGLKRTDGKRFLETEVYRLIGTFPVVYANGKIGLRRMNPVLADAPANFELNQFNVVDYGQLNFANDLMANVVQVDWNFVSTEGTNGRFTRRATVIDSTSIGIFKQGKTQKLQFKGLYGSRHTDATVRARINALRDRYARPPETITVSAMPHLNIGQVGQIARLKLPSVRDYAGNEISINRSFEVQRVSIDYAKGDVQFDLFGSTGRAQDIVTGGPGGEGPGGDNSLPDDWYDDEGTELSTVVDITVVSDVGVVDAGTYSLSGHASLQNAAAIYYYLGDLTIPDGVTINIDENVQLRVRGFLTINGVVNGVASGLAGVADVSGYGNSALGQAGFFASSRGMDGLVLSTLFHTSTLAAQITNGQQIAIPYFTITVESGALVGLPSDLRGTSGGPGGKVVNTWDKHVYANGGTGGDGGAGLCLVARGLALGASGTIDLSGGDSATPSAVSAHGTQLQPGAGGAGAPGGLLILLDGEYSFPDLSGGRFVAATGHVGAPLQNLLPTPGGGYGVHPNSQPMEGYLDPRMISDLDLSNSAYSVQFIPAAQTPSVDAPGAVPPPTNLTATGNIGGILIELALPAFDQFDSVQIYASADNNRANSSKIQEFKGTTYFHALPSSTTRYFWARTTRGDSISEWFPESATAGVSATSS